MSILHTIIASIVEQLTRPHNYDRGTHLPRLLPHIFATRGHLETIDKEHLIGQLKQAIGEEHHRGCINHPFYDINRHIALKQALSAELKITNCAS